MARITVEDCLTKETNRFLLVLLAAQRSKQLLHGSGVVITDKRENKAVVTALREIAAGQVRFMSEEEVRAEEIRLEEERIAASNTDSSAGEESNEGSGEENGQGGDPSSHPILAS